MSAFPATAAGGGGLEAQPAQSMLTACSVIVGRFLATIVVPLPGTGERCVVERLNAKVHARRVGELGPTPVVVTERWPGARRGAAGGAMPATRGW